MLESLYSGTFKWSATKASSIPQRSFQVTLNVPHKIKKRSAIVKDWKHAHLPFGEH